jgi:hypothetical protein
METLSFRLVFASSPVMMGSINLEENVSNALLNVDFAWTRIVALLVVQTFIYFKMSAGKIVPWVFSQMRTRNVRCVLRTALYAKKVIAQNASQSFLFFKENVSSGTDVLRDISTTLTEIVRNATPSANPASGVNFFSAYHANLH